MTWMLSNALLRDYANSHSSPELAAAFSEASSSDGEPSAPSNGSLTPRVFWCNARTTESSPLFPSGMTSRRLTDALGADVLTWCQEVFLAKTSAQPAKEPGLPVLARDYGVRWHALSAKWNRDTSLWKTRPSLMDEGWMSSLGTLPRWGLMRDGVLWERAMLVRLTNGIESGFLPTPVKYDSHGTWESNNYHGLGWSAKHDPSNLDERSRGARMWPTPVKNEDRASKYTIETSHRHFVEGSHQVHLAQAARDPRLYPTPTAQAAGHRQPPGELKATASGRLESDTGTYRQLDLGQVAKAFAGNVPIRYPTPVARDADNRQSKRPPERVRITATGLPEADRPSGTGKQLSLAQAAHAVDDGIVHRRGGTCTLGMGCDEAGACYAEANGQPARCEWQPLVMRRLPTPTHANGLRNGKEPGSSGGEHHPNKWQHPGHPEYGELNPEWVEWIMGWPIGWTSLEPMNLAAFEQWWALIQGNPDAGGLPLWWMVDPSDVPEAGISKTVKPKDKADDELRISRIGALGNGQVSAVIPAQMRILTTMKLPKEY